MFQLKMIFGIVAVAAGLFWINGDSLTEMAKPEIRKMKVLKEDAREAAELNCEIKHVYKATLSGDFTALARLDIITKKFEEHKAKLEAKYTKWDDQKALEREMERLMQEMGCATNAPKSSQRAFQEL